MVSRRRSAGMYFCVARSVGTTDRAGSAFIQLLSWPVGGRFAVDTIHLQCLSRIQFDKG